MPLVRVRENKQKDPQNKGFFVIVSKKVHAKAVARNRAKRRVREAARALGVGNGKVRVVRSIEAFSQSDLVKMLGDIFVEKKGFLD